MYKRKIPATMATQHPDHSKSPFFQKNEFISTADEIKESYLAYSQIGISECMWDWEGKLVDEAVIEKLLGEYPEFFRKNQLGKDLFLTFRIPDIKSENEFRLGRSLMALFSAANITKKAGLHSKPLFELILPMVQSAQEMISVHDAFHELSSLQHKLLHTKDTLKNIELIPLIEDVDIIINSDQMIEEYFNLLSEKFGSKPTYIRPLIARSDPALTAGLVSSVLATKIALSRYSSLEKKMGIDIYPILGPGLLPFRGGLSPDRVEEFSKEYSGVRTVLLQSAFRYDFSENKVKKAVSYLERTLPKRKAVKIPAKDEKKMIQIIEIFKKYYQESLTYLADEINIVASSIPKRRERFNQTGLLGYSRTMGEKSLPRAIGFTGSLYSLGIPPEFIGTGRGIREIGEKGLLPILEKYYLYFKDDLSFAGKYLNKKNLSQLAQKNLGWSQVMGDVQLVEEYLGKTLQPTTSYQLEHLKLSSLVGTKLENKIDVTYEVKLASVLRRSIG
ncbi:MAG: phosphoenolpyruvate carboxylase [Candidatus Pacebacteria bacterium]|nr:phosphoenolpyruvate carboxylase [Candidatus Paceibacterota bacterium]